MDRKWPLRTDILVCWKTYIFFVLYLLFISINRSFASTTVGWSNGEPRALNSCYIYLQFISCLFIVSITANIFEETFRTESRQYISVGNFKNHFFSLPPSYFLHTTPLYSIGTNDVYTCKWKHRRVSFTISKHRTFPLNQSTFSTYSLHYICKFLRYRNNIFAFCSKAQSNCSNFDFILLCIRGNNVTFYVP